MTRTSKALKRLGVAGLAAVTIGAGIPALVASSASAAAATGITISPKSQTNAVNTCTAYTVTVTPSPSTPPDSTTVDVLLSQDNPAYGANTPPVAGATLTFCDPDAAGQGTTPNGSTAVQDFSSGPGASAPATGTNVGGTSCTGPAPNQTQTSTTRCEAQFSTTGGGNTVTFGVMSNQVGTVNIIAFFDTNANRTPETFEPQDSAVLNVVSGVATTLVCTPESQNAPRTTFADFNCQVNASGAASAGQNVRYVVTSGPDVGTTGTTGAQCGSVDAANNFTAGTSSNTGAVVCRVNNSTGNLGTDAITFFVEQNGQAGPQAGEPADTSTATFTGAARNISCAPKTQTLKSADVSTVSCQVTDVNGNPVSAGQAVQFTSTGAGRFTDNSTSKVVTTNGSGIAVVNTTSQVNETGTQTVTAALGSVFFGTFTAYTNNGGTDECENTGGVTQQPGAQKAPSTPGNCSDTVTRTYTLTGSPSPSASSSQSSSTGTALTLSTSTPDIQPNIQGILTAHNASANTVVELRCYTRPNTTYFTARSTSVSTAGDVEFRILPGANTRCYVRYAGNEATASNSVVINVHTTLSLSAVRTAVRTYTFQGRNLPRRAGQLITLYRIANGQEIRTSNLMTDSSGIYRVSRHFTGTGTFQFRVRTSQTLNNAAGASNIITVTIH